MPIECDLPATFKANIGYKVIRIFTVHWKSVKYGEVGPTGFDCITLQVNLIVRRISIFSTAHHVYKYCMLRRQIENIVYNT